MWKSVRRNVGFPSHSDFRQISDATLIASFATSAWQLRPDVPQIDIVFTTKNRVEGIPGLPAMSYKSIAVFHEENNTLTLSCRKANGSERNFFGTILHECGHLVWRYGINLSDQVQFALLLEAFWKHNLEDFRKDAITLLTFFDENFGSQGFKTLDDFFDQCANCLENYLVQASVLSPEDRQLMEIYVNRISFFLEYLNVEEIFASSFRVYCADFLSKNEFVADNSFMQEFLEKEQGALKNFDQSLPAKFYIDRKSCIDLITGILQNRVE